VVAALSRCGGDAITNPPPPPPVTVTPVERPPNEPTPPPCRIHKLCEESPS
jgi:hypothetical protein